ncbi:XdhC family protein [Burkholderia sp. 3C]
MNAADRFLSTDGRGHHDGTGWHGSEREVLETAGAWRAAGHAVWLYTVVRTWGSAPRPVGAIMAMRGDGRICGSVSGGCIEDDLAESLRRDGPPGPLPGVVEYGLNADDAHRFGLPCGGTLRLVRETLGPASGFDALLDALRAGQVVARTLDLASGRATLAAIDGDAAAPAFDGRQLVAPFGPAWRLLLIGAGELSRYVAAMAVPLGYAVTLCDPRDDYATPPLPGVSRVRTMPDDTVLAMQPDARTAVIALTHDPKLDDLALIEALRTPAFYVGAIGSRRNSDARRERLKLFDLDDAQLARLHAPVGLHLGGSTPPEIAVSIVADLTARRHRVPVAGLRDVEAGKAGQGMLRDA